MEVDENGARIERINGMKFVRSTVESLEMAATKRRKRRQDAFEAERIAKHALYTQQHVHPRILAIIRGHTCCRV